jgi:DNA-binding response OmpR family regulator
VLSPTYSPSCCRIVVTDDDALKVSNVTQILRNAGHCVFAAFDGASALELIATLPEIRLLVTNTRLGYVNGPELMRRAREARPGLPILHLVARRGAPGSNPPDVLTLTEPFTPEQLLVAVDALMGFAGRSGSA